MPAVVAGALLVLVSVGRIIPLTDDTLYLDSGVEDICDLADSILVVNTARPNNSQHFYLGVTEKGSTTGFLASYDLRYVLTEEFNYASGCYVVRYHKLEEDQKIVNGAPYPSFIDKRSQIFSFVPTRYKCVYYIQSVTSDRIFTVSKYRAGAPVCLQAASQWPPNYYNQAFTTQNNITRRTCPNY